MLIEALNCVFAHHISFPLLILLNYFRISSFRSPLTCYNGCSYFLIRISNVDRHKMKTYSWIRGTSELPGRSHCQGDKAGFPLDMNMQCRRSPLRGMFRLARCTPIKRSSWLNSRKCCCKLIPAACLAIKMLGLHG